jgi:hypothetical protein
MARTDRGFWLRRLLCKGRPLWTRRPLAGQEGLRVGKLDHLVSPKTVAALGHHYEQGAPKGGSSTNEPGSIQGRTGPRSETLANDKVKPDAEKSPKEVVAETDRV